MNEQEDNGLTLKGLAHRLEALERENERIRSENAQLWGELSALRGLGTHRGEVVTLRGSDTPRDAEDPATEFAGRVSRRSLLSKAGAGAVAAVAAGTLLNANAREAKAGTDFFDTVWCADLIADKGGVRTTHTSGGRAVWAQNTRGTNPTVDAEHKGSGVGVLGTGVIGVRGHSSTKGQAGVYGWNMVPNGPGVAGRGVIGVQGNSSTTGQAGVYGENTARNGPGVAGRGEYGGLFEGAKAQLLLIPDAKPGKPTFGAHTKGELHLDSEGTLFVCTATATPGTWRKVTTTAVP
jgi:hypothetical protein